MVTNANLKQINEQINQGKSLPPQSGPSTEHIVLKTAKKNGGVVTPGEVALEGGITLDEAKKHLEELVSKGYAELRVKSSGVIVYVFTEFLDASQEQDLESI